jgi:Ca2+:H+ antiporter
VVSLVIPSIYAQVTQHQRPDHIESLSFDISWVLLFTYAASLLFSLKSHKHLFAPPEGEHDVAQELSHGPVWSVKKSMVILVVAAGVIGWVSEFLVHAVGEAGEALGLGKVFMGVVVVAVVGNAAEHSTAVLVAMKGKMDLSLGIAMGSSMQIALFVAPLLVIAGHWMGVPLGLEFTTLEVVAVMLSVAAVALLIHDGRTNWLEGLQLLAIYAILAMAFYFV